MTALQGVIEKARPAVPEKADVLHGRMTALGLDVSAWRRFRPAMLAELDHTCVACGCRAMCAHELQRHRDDPAWPGWRDYCPISTELDTMVALQFY